MSKYTVEFQKGKKIHKVNVTAQGLIPAIEEAVRKHFQKYVDSLGYEIVGAKKIA